MAREQGVSPATVQHIWARARLLTKRPANLENVRNWSVLSQRAANSAALPVNCILPERAKCVEYWPFSSEMAEWSVNQKEGRVRWKAFGSANGTRTDGLLVNSLRRGRSPDSLCELFPHFPLASFPHQSEGRSEVKKHSCLLPFGKVISPLVWFRFQSSSTPPPALSPSAFTSFMRAIMHASSRSSTARPRTAPSPAPS